MPLKLNVGVSRKVGQPNYGSHGASVQLELELESSLIEQPERLQGRIQELFRLAEVAVEEELASPLPETAANHTGHARTASTRAGHFPRPATAAQVRAIESIAEAHGVDLATLLTHRYGFEQPRSLTLADASQLIDELKNLCV